MNERIREFMPKPWVWPYPDRELYTKEQLEKFALLIVKKCIDIVDVGGEFVSRPKMVERLREHFGVEE